VLEKVYCEYIPLVKQYS